MGMKSDLLYGTENINYTCMEITCAAEYLDLNIIQYTFQDIT